MPNNFLTPDGLHWSDNTQVIPITGQVTGQISTENFGQTDGPTIPATTYTMNAGDSGRDRRGRPADGYGRGRRGGAGSICRAGRGAEIPLRL